MSKQFDLRILSIPIRKFKTSEIDFDDDFDHLLKPEELDDLAIIRDKLVRPEEIVNIERTFEGIVTQILDDFGNIAIVPKSYAEIRLKTVQKGSPKIIFAFRKILAKIYENSPDGAIDLEYHEIDIGSILLAQFNNSFVSRVQIMEVDYEEHLVKVEAEKKVCFN